MKVGDLVKFADLWAPDRHLRLGIVVEVEEGFYRVRVLWNTSEYSREPTNALKILSES